MHGADMGPGGGGAGRPSGPRSPPVALAPRDQGAIARPLLALIAAFALHVVLGVALWIYSDYKLANPDPPPPPLEVSVVEKPPPPPPKVEEPKPPPKPKPKPKPVPMKIAKAPPKIPQKALPPPPDAPPPPKNAPPPPNVEAKGPVTKGPIKVIAGITLESTVQGGTFAAPVGNTLYGTPSTVAPAPAEVKAYKAERYAPAAQVNELPSVLNREAVDLRKFYPPDALKREFEGEVVLRLLIDSDGSIAKAEVVSDPGQGLGGAAVRAVREYRFAPGKVNGTAVATTVPFVIRFVIN
jgi:protein TonB